MIELAFFLYSIIMISTTNRPLIIQGGMGVAVSNYHLANTVAKLGQLGVVSGVGLENVLIRRLQNGDTNNDMRRALAQFPRQDIAKRIIDDFYIEEGRKPQASYKLLPKFTLDPPQELIDVEIAAGFVEVWLAKEGHNNPIGINLLEKIQLSNLYTIYGAMLAGVDYVLMGAGIPREEPGILDRLANGEIAEMSLYVEGASPEEHYANKLNPAKFLGSDVSNLKRPNFLPIISSVSLGTMLKRRATGEVNGFVIEHHSAGGHNAPPRGQLQLSESGEPIYGPRDEVLMEQIAALNLPFWMGGHFGTHEGLVKALNGGAAGVQVGTAFAFCEESGITPSIKKSVFEALHLGKLHVATSPWASPTGFPFKVVEIMESITEKVNYSMRKRLCDMGVLRQAFKDLTGNVSYRCPAAPIEMFKNLGGKIEDTFNRVCLCNGLAATVGYAQVRPDGYIEKPIVTAGTFIEDIRNFLRDGSSSYSAADVIKQLLGDIVPQTAQPNTATE